MKILLPLTFLILNVATARALSPTQFVQAMEKNVEGSSFQAQATMTVKRDSDTRNMKMRIWWKDRRLALVKILEPKKDKDTGNLRIDQDLWQYLPKVNRIIRIPSSLMLQSWMGSDFSNDDLVRGGSLASDYTHRSLGKTGTGVDSAEKIECTPKPNAPVVWGKVILWVRHKDFAPMKQEFYTERGELIKVLTGENIMSFGKHHIPTKLTMTNVKKKNSATVINYEPSTLKFDEAIPEQIFTQENLRRGL